MYTCIFFESRPCRHLFLLKVSKENIPSPGRQIVSAHCCVAEGKCEFEYHFLNTLMTEKNSYMEGSSDLWIRFNKKYLCLFVKKN